jgi:hypothetical protein
MRAGDASPQAQQKGKVKSPLTAMCATGLELFGSVLLWDKLAHKAAAPAVARQQQGNVASCFLQALQPAACAARM